MKSLPQPEVQSHKKITVAWALRQTFRDGYNLQKWWADVRAGLTVAVVALPLGIALGIAAGVSPQNGLYSVVVGGAIIALLGGSRYQISGPTAAYVVLLVPVVSKFGVSGLLVAGLLSGFILIAMGYMRLAEIIQYIPHPVTTGFTSGIATVIAIIQIKDFFGLRMQQTPLNFYERILQLSAAVPTFRVTEIAIGVLTLIVLAISLKKSKVLPAPIVALVFVSLVVFVAKLFLPDLSISTIGNEFSYYDKHGNVQLGMPAGWPTFNWPWAVTTPTSPAYSLTIAHVIEIFPYAFSLALLGAMTSLLSAVVADGVSQKKHNSNSELIAQGVGNVLCPFFGGVPASGAIARTITNIRYGAVSPFSGVVHALVILIVLTFMVPLLNQIPLAALAAILLFVAYNMADFRHFKSILKTAPTDDRIVLMVCYTFTVFTDMTIGVGVGIGLAALLFIRRVVVLTGGDLFTSARSTPEQNFKLPPDTIMYRIKGSLFFGAAQKAVDALSQIAGLSSRNIIIDLSFVHIIDATGAVALNSALEDMNKKGKQILIVCNSEQVREVIESEEAFQKLGDKVKFADDIHQAIAVLTPHAT